MKIIKPSHNYMPHDCTPMQFIEKVGRICYKSTDKITDDSAVQFVKNLINRRHWAMLEHESIYLSFTGYDNYKELLDTIHLIGHNLKFFNLTEVENEMYVFSGNLRSFYELFELSQCIKTSSIIINIYDIVSHAYELIYSDLNLSGEKVETADVILYTREEFIQKYKNHRNVLFQHLTHTVKFVCDRGVSHELVRHRPCSFAQESTRYCNYSKDKFDKQITVILPCFYDTNTEDIQYKTWKHSCEVAEYAYFKLLNYGSTPQQARDVLPTSLKTEIIITTTEEEWQHIVNLRSKGTTGAPHPQMVEIMTPCFEELKDITNNRIN